MYKFYSINNMKIMILTEYMMKGIYVYVMNVLKNLLFSNHRFFMCLVHSYSDCFIFSVPNKEKCVQLDCVLFHYKRLTGITALI